MLRLRGRQDRCCWRRQWRRTAWRWKTERGWRTSAFRQVPRAACEDRGEGTLKRQCRANKGSLPNRIRRSPLPASGERRASVAYDNNSILPPTGMIGAGLLVVMTRSKRVALALPLAGDQRCLADILHRLAVPVHLADDRLIIGGDDRIEDGFGLQALRPLQRVDRDFEQGMLESDRLRPRPSGRLHVGVGQFPGALAGQAGLERMVRRPPDFGGQAVAARSERSRWSRGTATPCRW